MGNSDSKLEELESLRQQNMLNQAQISQLQQAMNLQQQQQIELLKKQQMELRKQQSTPISIPDNNPNSKEYNNYATQNQNRNTNDFRRNLGDRLFQDVENRSFQQPQQHPNPKQPPKNNAKFFISLTF